MFADFGVWLLGGYDYIDFIEFYCVVDVRISVITLLCVLVVSVCEFLAKLLELLNFTLIQS